MPGILGKTTSPARWICPRCGQENDSKMICPSCGFDNSTNYIAYPTLVELPRQANCTRRTVDNLEAEVQQLSAEVPRLRADLKAEVQQLRTEVSRLREDLKAEVQQLSAEVSQLQGEMWSLKAAQLAQERPSQSLNTAQPAQERPSQSLKTAQPAPKKPRWRKKPRRSQMGNIRQNLLSSNVPSLDGVTKKSKITEVYFLNTLKKAPENAADLSEAKDRSVLCWTKGTVQYIAGNGGVVGGSDCKRLFSYYENVKAIYFNGNFDTSNVTDMSQMFAYCYNLKLLNLSGWDTAHVVDMSSMFYCCSALESLNLSGWNTSRVKSMSCMFALCKSLTDFNPIWLDTSNAGTTKTNMYTGTKWA